jgi:hypothetical protein
MSETNPIKCSRHNEYLSADAKTRRTKLKFNNIGPLIQEDSIQIGTYLKNLCKDNFVNKPDNYEYDVLYPEVSFTFSLSFSLSLLILFKLGNHLGIKEFV